MILNSFIFVFFFFITPLYFLLFLLRKKNGFNESLSSPPKLPIIGNLHQLGAKSPHRALLCLSRKYGDLMFLQLGSVPTLIVSSARMVQEIFKNHDLAFSSRPSTYAIEKMTNNYNISAAPYGEYWRDARKVVVLELLTVRKVESFERVRVEEVGFMMDEIAKASNSEVNLSSLAFRLANTLISRVAFGRRSDPEFDGIMKKVLTLSSEFNISNYFPFLRCLNKINGVDKRIDQCNKELDLFMDRVYSEHRSRSKLDSDWDIVDVLLGNHKEPHRSSNLTLEQIRAVLLDLFFAATDTSSATIEWTMAELVRNPETLDKLRQEVREIGAGKQAIQEEDLPRLTYLKLVIKESLRLHPPAPLLLPREVTETCSIGGKWVIPEKTRVIINATALSMDPEYWKRPEIFCPERFADSRIDYRGQHFGYLPFGIGRRSCPGTNFAMQLVELALANLVFRYDWEPPVGTKPEEIDMEEEFGIVMHKKAPLCLVAKPVLV